MATPEDLHETVRLVEDLDRRIVAHRADVRDGADAAADQRRSGGRIRPHRRRRGQSGDLLRGRRSRWELSDAQWHDTLDVNLTGYFELVRAVVPSMIEAGRGGSIIFTSSLLGTKGAWHMSHYAAAEARGAGTDAVSGPRAGAPHDPGQHHQSDHGAHADDRQRVGLPSVPARPRSAHARGLRHPLAVGQPAAHSRGSRRSTSRTPSSGWPRTRPATSPGWPCPSMPAPAPSSRRDPACYVTESEYERENEMPVANLIIDSDSHVTEPADVWTARVPKKYIDDVPHVERIDGADIWMLQNKRIGSVGTSAPAGWPTFPRNYPPTYADCHPAASDADGPAGLHGRARASGPRCCTPTSGASAARTSSPWMTTSSSS